MNKKLAICWFLLVALFSCSEEKEAPKIKSIFDIPENASENSLVHFGFKKQTPEKKGFVDFFGDKGNKIYEYNIKNYALYIYKKKNITSEIKFVQGTISFMHISVDTTIWNEIR